jgi:hypothetical protein
VDSPRPSCGLLRRHASLRTWAAARRSVFDRSGHHAVPTCGRCKCELGYATTVNTAQGVTADAVPGPITGHESRQPLHLPQWQRHRVRGRAHQRPQQPPDRTDRVGGEEPGADPGTGSRGGSDSSRKDWLPSSRHTFAWRSGPPPRRLSEDRFRTKNEGHRPYFEAMNVALGSVGLAAWTHPEVADGLAPNQSLLDLPIIRMLAPHHATLLGTVATAAAPESGAGYAVWIAERAEGERQWPRSRAEPRGPAGPR